MRLSELTSAQMHDRPENLMGRLAACTYMGAFTKEGAEAVAARCFPGSDATATLTKSATNPAMSSVAGWAQELTKIVYGEFIDLLRAEAILPQVVPLAQQHRFDGAASLKIPVRLGTATDVAASFVLEGEAIPVRAMTVGSLTLAPRQLGVILSSTEEMRARSAVDLAQFFQRAITADTASYLDTIFLGAGPATAKSPAGSRNGLTAADSRAATGVTAAAISADVKTMVKAITSANLGAPATTRWIMHPQNAAAVGMLLNATSGARQFPEAEQGRLAGYEVLASTVMDPAVVLLIDFSAYSFAISAPQFYPTQVSELHMDDAPVAIGTPGTPAVVAAPTRSLFQTATWALKMTMSCTWEKMRAVGPVQQLSAVAWA